MPLDFGVSPSVIQTAVNSTPDVKYSPLSDVFKYKADMESKNLHNETQRLQLDEIKKGLADAPKDDAYYEKILDAGVKKAQAMGNDTLAEAIAASKGAGPDGKKNGVKIAMTLIAGEQEEIDTLDISDKFLKQMKAGQFKSGAQMMSYIESIPGLKPKQREALNKMAAAYASTVDEQARVEKGKGKEKSTYRPDFVSMKVPGNDKPVLVDKANEPEHYAQLKKSGAVEAAASDKETSRKLAEDHSTTKNVVSLVDRLKDQVADPAVATNFTGEVVQGIGWIKDQYRQMAEAAGYKNYDDDTEKTSKDRIIAAAKRIGMNERDAKSGAFITNVFNLAYAMAKSWDRGGRVTDKDFDIAVQAIGSGSKESRVAALDEIRSRVITKYEQQRQSALDFGLGGTEGFPSFKEDSAGATPNLPDSPDKMEPNKVYMYKGKKVKLDPAHPGKLLVVQ